MRNNLMELIDKNKIIFFDVFDTLIKRYVEKPENIFNIVELRYQNLYGVKIDFAKRRKKAEKNARKKYTYTEVNLDEIYMELLTYYKKDICDRLKELELKTEIDFCLPNKEIKSVFYYCIENKKRVFIISDMYLQRNTVAEMLKKCGYIGYEQLYVSCEYRKTKWHNGELFNFVIENNNLDRTGIVHIGDNKHVDYNMAKRQGLQAYLVSDNLNKSSYFSCNGLTQEEKLIYEILNRFINLTINDKCSRSYQIGYEVFGPLLYGYTCWLINKLEENRIKKVFFFSRDGYIMQKAFNILKPDFENSYFYASRRSIVTALLQYDDTLEEMIRHYKSWPKKFDAVHLFEKLGLDTEDYKKILKEDNGINVQNLYELNNLDKAVIISNSFKKLKPVIYEKSKQTAILFKNYLKQEDFYGRVGIVENGGGTIEKAITDFINKEKLNVDINVFYFTTQKDNDGVNKYLDMSPHNLNTNYKLKFCYMLLECFFSAPHGSVKGYKSVNGKIEPLLGKYYYDGDKFKYDVKLISDLRNGALDFIKNINQDVFKNLNFNVNVAIQNFWNFGCKPNYKDVDLLGKYRFDGDSFKGLVKINNSRIYYLSHINKLVKDIMESYWPAGFLVKIISTNAYNEFICKLYYCYKRFKEK